MASTTVTNFAHLQIPLEDVVNATDNFHEKNIIGRGGFGTAYKGRLLISEKLMKIAALRLTSSPKDRDAYVKFWTEISMLSDLNHTNLVSIVGFCDEKNEKIIITMYATKGSVMRHLKSPNLTWTQRLKICVGVARVLSYLHSDKKRGYGVIHLNVNSSTILLDENWEAKLSGFKVSIKQSLDRMDRVILSEPIGTEGYNDPEVEKTRGVTYKSDIYSFGVVLFELLCGRKAFVRQEANQHLAPLAREHVEKNTLKDVIPPDLWNQIWSPQSLMLYSNAAYSCTHEERTHRPTMEHILQDLEKALELQLRRENMGKNLKHLKIPLDDIYLATHNLSMPYRLGYSDYFAWYRAEVDHFDIEKPSSTEGNSKGDLPKRRSNVVIKQFLPKYAEDAEEFFFTELGILARVKHHNIVKLKGFCVEGSKMMLVIENASDISLQHSFVHDKVMRILTWEKRLKICIDIAQILNYLHFEMEDNKVVIHGNIRSTNIGLDENWGANIDEFERAVFLPPNQDVKYNKTFVCSKYYADPECVKNRMINRESDVYSFGVVLFEILCGKKANDPNFLKESDEGLAHVAIQRYYMITLEDIIDPLLNGKDGENNYILDRGSFDTFCKIAYDCVAKTQDQRPTIKVVLKELEKALYFQQNKDTQRMSLEDIKLATQDFHDDNCIGGGGSFGKVYKGKIPQGDGLNTIVAKVLNTRLGQEEKLFWNELHILSEYKHGNIIRLVGYCDETDEKVIVYEYASRRSLDRYVNDASLTWIQRLNICIDVASALDFLHGGRDTTVIAHGDIKTTNILLNYDWKAKLSGFGLSLINPLNQETNCEIDHSCGTPGYLDPLYIKTGSGFLTKEADIHSFGVVLFEILCGRSTNAIHKYKGRYLPDFIRKNFEEGKHDEIVLEQIKEQIMPKSLTTFQTIAYQCLYQERKRRPTSKEVLMELKKALEIQEGRVQHSNIDQVVNRLEILSRELRKKTKDNPIIALEKVKEATQNFHEDNCIGKGGFGKVYKGSLQDGDGFKTIVAKRLITTQGQGEQEFLGELQILLEYKHENVIGLEGYCDEKGEKIIVFEYASGKSLDGHLHNTYLTWVKRLQICIDVASALDFIHGGVGKQARVVHRDIKAANILLTHDCKAKLADFGLSLISPINQETNYVIDQAVGTQGYMDPLYQTLGFLTIESDIYSFGVVLFEMLCGRSTFQIYKQEGHHLPNFVKKLFEEGKQDEMVMKQIREQIRPDSLSTFQKIALQCLHHEREKRPSTKNVLWQLKKALEFQNMPSTIDKCDPLKIPLQDVVDATNNFHRDNIIRHGRYGTAYKGQPLRSGEQMKIEAQRIDRQHGERNLEFIMQISLLSDLKHKNVVRIIGYCDEKDEKIIITKYQGAESLGQYLNNPNVTWTERLRICLGVARALSYLHYDKGRDYAVIHCNINSDTILLDKNREAKLSGFEFSIKQLACYEDQVCLFDPHEGTMGYMDPAFEKTGGVTHKSDIYSFGIVLFEILCGRKAYIQKEANEHLAPLAKDHHEKGTLKDIIHPNLHWNQMSPHALLIYSEIAYSCLSEDRADRPNINYIVDELEKALELQLLRENIVNCKANPRIPLESIKQATQNFHSDNCIGAEGFLSVYKGNLQDGDTFNTIVVKRLDTRLDQVDQHFLNELQILSKYKHQNVIGLVGNCEEEGEKIIVYEHASNTSLDKYLNDASLAWMQRLNIGIDIASALEFFHGGVGKQAKVIHRDIKSAHILLNHDWKAKLSDFRLSLICPINQETNNVIDHVSGTRGYLDPLYEKLGFLTTESDIFSFGVVLFEMLCGRSTFTIHKHEGHYLPDFVKKRFEEGKHDEVVMEQIREQIFPESLTTFQEIAYRCLHHDRAKRPKAKEVLTQLKKALEFQVSKGELASTTNMPNQVQD